MATTPPKRAYDFSIQVPIHRPRAWERLPKTALATRHRGRKVWKRYELRSKEKTGTRENPISIAEDDGEKGNGKDGSPARPVKRRRNGNGAGDEESGAGREGAAEGREVGYIATMRSEAPGTPKRGFPVPDRAKVRLEAGTDHVVLSRQIRKEEEFEAGSVPEGCE